MLLAATTATDTTGPHALSEKEPICDQPVVLWSGNNAVRPSELLLNQLGGAVLYCCRS
jgi:hypothetical protein